MNAHATDGDPNELTITCTKCWREQPAFEFRLRDKAGNRRHRTCRTCYNEETRLRRLAVRNRVMYQFAKEVNWKHRDYHAIAALLDAMRLRFGSWDNFLDQWFIAVEAARATRNSALVFRMWRVMFSLLHAGSQAWDDYSRTIEQLSDQDLEREFTEAVERLVREQPELLMWALSQLPGWTVIPPQQEQNDVTGDEVES